MTKLSPDKAEPIAVSLRSKFPSSAHGASFIAVGEEVRTALGGASGYWIGVVSLVTAKVVASGLATSNDEVPDIVKPYLDDADHALLLAANNLNTDHLPQGDFATFLRLTGSGNTLRAIEQFVSQQYQSGAYAGVTYVLAATLSQSDAPGFETASFFHDSWLTLALAPFQVDGSTRYMLVRS